MTTQAILKHHAHLKARGLNLGAAAAMEEDAGYGGRVQAFVKGTIYWHPSTGAHALRGRILERYRQAGAQGPNPASGRRELGFPSSDHQPSEDGAFECATFEWGLISAVSGTPLVRIFGPIYASWRAGGGAIGPLGHPLSDVMPVDGGHAAWFERGVIWHAEGSPDTVTGILDPPSLGQPALVDPGQSGPFDWISFEGAVGQLDARPGLAAALFTKRLAFVPARGGEPLVLVPAAKATAAGTRRRLSLTVPRAAATGPRRARMVALSDTILGAARAGTAGLEHRTLYSLAFVTPGMAPRAIAPHCLYARKDWETFGLAHITDLHVSRRIERYRSLLRARGVSDEDVARMNNWNDAFRAFIRYANHLHQQGRLDVIIATGDLVDYVRELDDHPNGPGNFGLFEAIVQGLAPGGDPESTPAEPLRVPIFTSLGNHDYRQSPYPLAFKVVPTTADFLGDIPLVGDAIQGALDGLSSAIGLVPGLGELRDPVGIITEWQGGEVNQYGNLNLIRDEATKLIGLKSGSGYGVPALRPDAVAPSVRIETSMKGGSHYYFRRINPSRSYVIRLGSHRVVMLDTRWDANIPDTVSELVAAKVAGLGPESTVNFALGTPDSVGATTDELEVLRGAIAEAGTAVVLVGMHAPPLNPAGTDLANCLRETVHGTTHPDQIRGWLRRNGAIDEDEPGGAPGWLRGGTPHFHSGPVEDHLDYGIAVGRQEVLARILAGGEGQRPVTMLCSGHGHTRVEYRLKWDPAANALLTFTDHYLSNPARYYPSRLVEGDWRDPETHRRYLVRIEPGASPADGTAADRPDLAGTIWEGARELVVPPYPKPLEGYQDAAAWWQHHAPVVVQTAALGPCTNTRASVSVNREAPGPNFQGFRLLSIAGKVIERAEYLLMDEVRTVALPSPTPPPQPGGLLDASAGAALVTEARLVFATPPSPT